MKEGDPMRLSVDQASTSDLFEKAVLLQEVASWAAAGSNALMRLRLGEPVTGRVMPSLEQGRRFLEKVVSDLEDCVSGVEPLSPDFAISYNPKPVLQLYQGPPVSTGHQTDRGARRSNQRTPREPLPDEGQRESLAAAIDELHAAIERIERGELTERKAILETLEKYEDIARPYLNSASRATEEYQIAAVATEFRTLPAERST